jgi:hypothetical protein
MIKILFLVAISSNSARLRFEEERRAQDQALPQAEFQDRFGIRQHWDVRIKDRQGLLLRYKPHIAYFSDHGNVASEIILEDDYGNSQAVFIRVLSQLFSILRDNIRCVILNACYFEVQAKTIAEHIDCVIKMFQSIVGSSALSFATTFYQAIGYGRDIKTAFDLEG